MLLVCGFFWLWAAEHSRRLLVLHWKQEIRNNSLVLPTSLYLSYAKNRNAICKHTVCFNEHLLAVSAGLHTCFQSYVYHDCLLSSANEFCKIKSLFVLVHLKPLRFLFRYIRAKYLESRLVQGKKVYWYKYAKGNSFQDCMFMTVLQANMKIHV